MWILIYLVHMVGTQQEWTVHTDSVVYCTQSVLFKHQIYWKLTGFCEWGKIYKTNLNTVLHTGNVAQWHASTRSSHRYLPPDTRRHLRISKQAFKNEKGGLDEFEARCLKKQSNQKEKVWSVYYYSSPVYMKHTNFIQARERQTFC